MAASGQDRIERRLAAILAADVAGYSRLTGVDEEGTHVQLQAHLRALVDPKVAEHRGRVVKNTGDGMLAEFSSVVDAMRCALDIQREMAERNAEVPVEKRIEFRIGINVGDIIIDRNDIFGDGVNVAARLEGLAKPGGICVSDDVYRQVRGKFDVTFEDTGERQLKNIARPVRVFQVALDDARPAKPISQHNVPSAVRRRWSTFARPMGAAVLLIVGVVGIALYFHLGRTPVQLPDQLAKPHEGFSIVVLPFANLSGDASQDYLADVISDELTTGFSRFRNSFVISRSTAFTYKGKPINVRQIGKDLGVHYALEGSVQPSGDRLRVNAQLIDTESNAHVWADRFDENRSDLLQMQDAIVHRIAFAIGIKLTDVRAREAQTRAANPNAEDLAFRCSAALMRTVWTSERDSAFGLCEQALEIDPQNVRALSHLTFKFTQRYFLLAAPDIQAAARRADELASLAVKIDPGYHMAHVAKGDALLVAGRYREAIDSYERALMLVPSTILIGLPLAYNFIGEPEQAMAYADKAIRLTSHASLLPTLYLAKAIAFSMLNDAEQALVWIERAEAAAPDILLIGLMRSALLALAGKREEARAAMQRYLANDKSPIRTLSQWHARQSEKPLPSYNPLVLARLLILKNKFDDGLRTAGLPE
ncbi:adenylate/guanylate cyclase domain-containing protein [Bradyrhizobium sp. Arg816]|uniref:adenylate/guanylate cyclase domain-containing protein n=1 Tax=Bradyrhizobium sp. Arg816 TaxID=2998491 RepID=UPI00249F0B7A|nr:adenylate/guanylate cyclase domain-containing protein [Bradyrhizobium sp. Arg816]MDI3561836.1 adenylate/guanylate cyclase domain-containing protein [Bradyrhizobium sp. Arg816]